MIAQSVFFVTKAVAGIEKPPQVCMPFTFVVYVQRALRATFRLLGGSGEVLAALWLLLGCFWGGF